MNEDNVVDFYETQVNGVTVLKARGVIDESNVHWLEIKLDEIFSKKNYRLVIDMDKMSFSGPVVWGLVLSYLWTLNEKGGGLKLSSLNDEMRKVFKKMEFSGIFEAYETQQDALNSFRAQ